MSNNSSHALFIGSVWPEPNSSAAGWRTLSIMHMLQSDGWKITFAGTAADSPHRQPLQPLGIDEQVIELNHPSFDAFVSDLQPDLVVFDRFMIEEQFGWRVAEQCPKAMRLLDTQDLHFLRDARQQAVKKEKTLVPSPVHSDKAFREIASIYRCDLSLIISSFEMQWLQQQQGVPAERLYHLPFLFDPLSEDQVAAWPGFEDREHYVSIGNFRHAPNWDAVRYLKQTLWPLIRNLQPTAQLHIYGAYPPKSATQLHAPDEGFHIRGWAENAHAVLSSAQICLAPLRFGAGLKGKLAEAMQCGTPSVTTPIGAEGMHGANPWCGVIEKKPELLAQAAIDLYHDQNRWQVCQRRGQTILNQLFNKPKLQAECLTTLADRANQLADDRRRNFTGAMLQHHTLQSSLYLARWIEAKNNH